MSRKAAHYLLQLAFLALCAAAILSAVGTILGLAIIFGKML